MNNIYKKVMIYYNMNIDYQTLDISIQSSNEEIKKAYQKKAKLLHPDKGGSDEDFNQLKESYDRIIKQRKKRSFNDSFLQRDYINIALSNRFQRMETMVLKEMNREINID